MKKARRAAAVITTKAASADGAEEGNKLFPTVKPERAEQRNDPRLFERALTPQQLADGVDEYFAMCKETGRKPTRPGLCNHLGITTGTWDKWNRGGQGDGGEKKGLVKGDSIRQYSLIAKRAQQQMSDELEQRTDTMALFLLKQAFYGGYTDKTDNSAAGNLSVSITFGETHKNTARGYGK
jgi:hypothetical protein